MREIYIFHAILIQAVLNEPLRLLLVNPAFEHLHKENEKNSSLSVSGGVRLLIMFPHFSPIVRGFVLIVNKNSASCEVEKVA